VLKHRALDDIRESIEELKYYRQSIFVSEEERVARKDRAIAAKHETGGDTGEPHAKVAK
jgi:hypothetical protein